MGIEVGVGEVRGLTANSKINPSRIPSAGFRVNSESTDPEEEEVGGKRGDAHRTDQRTCWTGARDTGDTAGNSVLRTGSFPISRF